MTRSRSTRSSALTRVSSVARSGAAITSSISASMVGSARPERLKVPDWPAASDPKSWRSSTEGESGEDEAARDDVVVEDLLPLLVLRGVDGVERGVDADGAEVFDVRQDDAFEGAGVVEELHRQRLSGGVAAEAVVAHGPAGLVEERARAARDAAVERGGAAGRGREGGFVEDGGGKLVAEGFEDGEFLACERAFGLHRGVCPEAVGALVEPVEQRLVRPFEVEHHADGFADAAVLELLAPHVEPEALRARGAGVGDLLLDDPFAGERGEVVGGRPLGRDVLLVEEVVAGLQRLERGGRCRRSSRSGRSRSCWRPRSRAGPRPSSSRSGSRGRSGRGRPPSPRRGRSRGAARGRIPRTGPSRSSGRAGSRSCRRWR